MADKGLAGDASNAVCAGHWLAAWARGGAMLGTMSSRQAGYERKWRTAGIAVAYLKAREHVEAADRAVIEQWLDRLADAVEADYGRPKSRNNHYYWAGFAAAAVGTATGSARHLGYASEAFNDGLSAIAADGTLPGEMARKVRALHYNAYALAPLVLMAELAALRGEDWYARHGGAIHRLAAAVRGGVHDPAGFARKAGVPTVEAPTGGVFAWRAFYAARFPARWPDPLEGTLNYPWYGGDCGLAAEVWIKRQGK
nr:alginate lyase family protein [Alsobacter ponti]